MGNEKLITMVMIVTGALGEEPLEHIAQAVEQATKHGLARTEKEGGPASEVARYLMMQIISKNDVVVKAEDEAHIMVGVIRTVFDRYGHQMSSRKNETSASGGNSEVNEEGFQTSKSGKVWDSLLSEASANEKKEIKRLVIRNGPEHWRKAMLCPHK